MGTSGSRTGKYSESGSEWSAARRELTSLARGTGGSVEGALRTFAQAASTPAARDGLTGGAFSAASRTAQRLGAFLGQVRSAGVLIAAQEQGLPGLADMTPADALFAIAEAFGERDGSLASSVSYTALSHTIEDLLREDHGVDTAELFDWLASNDGMRHLLETYIANTVDCLLLSELGDRIENSEAPAAESSALIEEMREYVRAHVAFSMEGIEISTFDWTGSGGEKLILDSLDAALAALRTTTDA